MINDSGIWDPYRERKFWEIPDYDVLVSFKEGEEPLIYAQRLGKALFFSQEGRENKSLGESDLFEVAIKGLEDTRPVKYDPLENEMSENGEKITKIDEFYEKNKNLPGRDFVNKFLKNLYDSEGFDLTHSTDIEGISPSNTDIEVYDENIFKCLDERGHAFCGELEKMLTYAARKKGIESNRMFGDIVIRYDDANGVTIPNEDGSEIVGHGFNSIKFDDKIELIDPSIYMHLREAGADHEEAVEECYNREEVYYRNPGLTIAEEDYENIDFIEFN